MKISASFLGIKENIKENIKKLDNTSIDYLHCDIMDGIFVENKTMSFVEIEDYLEEVTKPLDVHLMVENILDYINDYKKLKPLFITFHVEIVDNPLFIINYLRQNNIKVGISLKPNSNIDKILPYLNLIDLVLIMSVEPGYGGQKFIMSTVSKIEELYQIRNENNYQFLIEVDGGINNETIKYCNKADIIVIGNYITSSNNYQLQINKLLEFK